MCVIQGTTVRGRRANTWTLTTKPPCLHCTEVAQYWAMSRQWLPLKKQAGLTPKLHLFYNQPFWPPVFRRGHQRQTGLWISHVLKRHPESHAFRSFEGATKRKLKLPLPALYRFHSGTLVLYGDLSSTQTQWKITAMNSPDLTPVSNSP